MPKVQHTLLTESFLAVGQNSLKWSNSKVRIHPHFKSWSRVCTALVCIGCGLCRWYKHQPKNKTDQRFTFIINVISNSIGRKYLIIKLVQTQLVKRLFTCTCIAQKAMAVLNYTKKQLTTQMFKQTCTCNAHSNDKHYYTFIQT